MIRSRNAATVLALVVVLAVLGLFAFLPTSNAVFSPGPTIDVLGKMGDQPIITVKGHPAYRDKGQLRLVTIIASQPGELVSLLGAMGAWMSSSDNIYPVNAVYAPQENAKQAQQQNAAEMSGSQSDAIAAALRALKIPYHAKFGVSVAAVQAPGPSDGKIQAGDAITAIDGKATPSQQSLLAAVRAIKPGSRTSVTVLRGTRMLTLTVRTEAAGTSGAASHQSRVGVSIAGNIAYDYRFPFKIAVHLPDNIGGPSAGLMFSLSIYDVLTPGSLTGGRTIAGTGTIDDAGTVGEIGGIQEKLAGAKRDGAKLFLVPAGNCQEAMSVARDVAPMRLAKVSTMAGALKVIKTWAANPNAPLPSCD